MGFFGEVISQDKTEIVVPEGYILKILQACLDIEHTTSKSTSLFVQTGCFISKKSSYILIFCEGNEERGFCIAVFDSKCQLNCQLQHEFGPEDSPIVFWTKGSEIHLTGSWIWEEDSSTECDDSACEDADHQHSSASTENVASKPTTSKKNKIDQTISDETKPTKKSKKNSKGESKSQAEGDEVEVELAVVCRPPTDITLDAKPWKVKPQNDEGVLVPSPKLRGLSSGVSVCDFIVGRGVEPKLGSVVHLTYEGYFPSGELFDANLKRKKPFKFRKGVGQVVRGLDLGLEGLRVGGAREVYIPFELGYGAKGFGKVPPLQPLVFRITLVGSE